MRDADEALMSPCRHAAGASSLFMSRQTASTSATGGLGNGLHDLRDPLQERAEFLSL
jgi:hypothetical protein